MSQKFTEFTEQVEQLIKRDRDLAAIVNTYGHPPLWQRKPGFATLIQIILEQQVSLSSAKAAFDRLEAAVSNLTAECGHPQAQGICPTLGERPTAKLARASRLCRLTTTGDALASRPFQGGERLTPTSFLSLDDAELKAIGFSRQKTRYGRELARAIAEKTLDLASLESLADSEVRKQLTKIKGIGDWTADMYLMMALQRQDVFPSKDLAVAIAIKEIKNLETRPKAAELEQIAQPWQPYRAIATQILWHYYLNRSK